MYLWKDRYIEKKVYCFYIFFLVKKEVKNKKKPQDAFSQLICAATMSTTKSKVNNKGNNKITELRTILQRESQNS